MIDNLSNSFLEVFDRMKEVAGANATRMKFIKV